MVRLELTGQRFAKLIVVSFSRMDERQQSKWNCLCDCGNICEVAGTNLRRGTTHSCGCFVGDRNREIRTTHGRKRTAEYRIWGGMKQRCRNENYQSYPRYGGRGIDYCERWESFENFFEDMGERPSSEHSIGRIENDKGYYKDNCQWELPKQQQNNLSSNRRISIDGVEKTATEWAERYGMDVMRFFGRLKLGWEPLKALTTPIRPKVKTDRAA